MLNNVGDLITETLVRNATNTADGFITDAMLQDWCRQSLMMAASYKKWPMTEGKVSTTFSTSVQDELGNTLINYPEGWKADSVRIVYIGGKSLKKMNFESFLRYLENYSQNFANNNRRIYSDYGRQIYVNSGIDLSGTMVIYGQYSPTIDPTDLTATTFFSGYDEEGNEAILYFMSAFLNRRKKNFKLAQENESKAREILDGVWARIGDEQYKYQTGPESMFERIDVLTGRGNYPGTDRRENQF